MAILATSGSSANVPSTCQITLDIFSGRPNPHWTLSAAECSVLLKQLEALPAAGDVSPSDPPGLGYRGVIVDAPGKGPLRLFGGVVTDAADGSPRHLDRGRAVELSIARASKGHISKELTEAAIAAAGG